MNTPIRSFDTGATRSADAGRYDPEGFLSPIVIERFCEYMNRHRVQPDGSIRSSDNWQKGIPRDAYMKGMWRHFLHLWTRHRGHQVQDPGAAADMEEDLCALLFNVQGMLFEVLRAGPHRIIAPPPVPLGGWPPIDFGRLDRERAEERNRALSERLSKMPLQPMAPNFIEDKRALLDNPNA